MKTRRWWAAGVALGAAFAVWLLWPTGTASGRAGEAHVQAAAAPPAASKRARSAPMRVPTAAEVADRSAARSLWQTRLERARAALATYRHTTRYPHGSRPAREQADQMHPDRPIVEERPLRLPGGAAVEGLLLRTTQQRVFAQGEESVRLTVAAVDDGGQPLPLAVAQARAHTGVAGEAGAAAPLSVPVAFSDDGRGGDARAGDAVHTFTLHPATQGFAQVDGTIRVEATLQSGAQAGWVQFDVIYSPLVPATWAGPVRSRLVAGSLRFELPVNVQQAGRYVATGRVDDAKGQPFALLTFNGELAEGAQLVALTLFGKQVRDEAPPQPLALRDVQAFWLRENHFPDRALLVPLRGPVHTASTYPLVAFSDAEWTSEERSRYLAELSGDVAQAEQALAGLP